MMDSLEHKKYPIGKFGYGGEITDQHIDEHIATIKNFPTKLKDAIRNFSDDMLDTQYRTDGWTVRQLVSHLADSHMQSFSRFKLALTEDNPTIKPYDEAKWAELQDCRNEPVKASLMILEGLHCRWTHLLKTMTNKDFERTFFHPEHNKKIYLRDNVAFYAWHCRHHLAHIESLKKEKGWA